MKNNFDIALDKLQIMKHQNLELFKEIFLNDCTSEENVEVSIEDFSSSKDAEKAYASVCYEENNYASSAGVVEKSFQDEESYQDYLNNADLDPLEELSILNS